MKTNTQLLLVKNWVAWAPGLPSKKDWLAWSQKPSAPIGTDKIEAASIPSMLKRRCSHLSKMALEVSSQAIQNHTIDYAVFCAQHGEINSTVHLLKEISEKTVLSPTNFSQSVHNTAAGLFSMIHKLQENMTSIAAGNETFLMGMIEAITWLKLNPEKTVLLTMFDEVLPDEYQSLNVQNNYTYAISMVLTNQCLNTRSISLSFNTLNTDNKVKHLPQALEFLAWFLRPTKEILIQQSAIWCKNE